MSLLGWPVVRADKTNYTFSPTDYYFLTLHIPIEFLLFYKPYPLLRAPPLQTIPILCAPSYNCIGIPSISFRKTYHHAPPRTLLQNRLYEVPTHLSNPPSPAAPIRQLHSSPTGPIAAFWGTPTRFRSSTLARASPTLTP